MKRIAFGICALMAIAGCDEGGSGCAPGEKFVGGVCVQPAAIQLNSVGFLPDRVKRATSTTRTDTFRVLYQEGGAVAFTGTSSTPKQAEDGGSVYELDFSAFDQPGRYYVEVPGVGRSPAFDIASDVYRQPFAVAMLSFYGQRCGTAVQFRHQGQLFSHGECHAEDAYLDFVTGETSHKSSQLGWHDAGDYGKYTINGAFAAGLLLKAWEHFRPGLQAMELELPERGGPIPDLLDEVKFELEWLLTAQFENGAVSHKVTAQEFETMIAPEQDRQRRYFAPFGSAAAATFTAVMAQAARVYAEFDVEFADRCRNAALTSYAYLTANTADLKPNLAGFRTGGYGTADRDDRAWAAAEVWETTGDLAALADFEARGKGLGLRVDWDWSELGNLAVFTYVLSARTGRDQAVVDSLSRSVVSTADTIVQSANEHPYGRGVGNKYYWGSNGVVVRTAMNLAVAHRLEAKDDYLDAIVSQLDHVLGRNPYGRSFVTGLGHLPPMNPHHRPSAADGVIAPWPGQLVGGPEKVWSDWVDEQESYRTNEVAINWSAALAYALAAFVE
jgi:endoglucanase